MKKQLLLLLLLMLSLVTNAADVVIDGVFYNLSYNDKVAEVTSNPNKYSGVVTIPNSFTYGGTEYRVTKIGGGAFLGCSDLTSVGIPESVINIGYRAFAFCTGLTSVDIPYSVTNIEEKAFWNCSNLTSIIIPNSVTYIGADVFYYLPYLRFVWMV